MKHRIPAQQLMIDSPISQHAQHIVETIYHTPYKQSATTNDDTIARDFHGGQHVTRVSCYLPILINFWRKFANEEAKSISERQLKLLQITALFHDAGREGDNEDLWDNDSAISCFYYLQTLGLSNEEACLYAESIANKDIDSDKNAPFFSYHQLVLSDDGHISIKKSKIANHGIYKKPFLWQLIHDADCLDIIRARDFFDAHYLDCYQQLACNNDEAMHLLANLISQIRSVIYQQGDGRLIRDDTTKRQYEHNDAVFKKISTDINDNGLLTRWFANNQLLTDTQLASISIHRHHSVSNEAPLHCQSYLESMMDAGLIYARSIASPSAQFNHGESFAECELRHTYSRVWQSHTTVNAIGGLKQIQKEVSQNGNAKRSVTRLGFGTQVYACAGFLIVKPNLSNISSISVVDNDTGRGNKTFNPSTTLTAVYDELNHLSQSMKTGKKPQSALNSSFAGHNECLLDIDKMDAIYFTDDPCVYDDGRIKGRRRTSTRANLYPYAPYLQALYLQQCHYNQAQIDLPIVRYSFIDNQLEPVSFNDDEIIAMWDTITRQAMQHFISRHGFAKFKELSIDKIKVLAVYQQFTSTAFERHMLEHTPVDQFYSASMKHAINQVITEHKQYLINDYLENQLWQKGEKRGFYHSAEFINFLSCTTIEEIDQDKRRVIETSLIEQLAKKRADFLINKKNDPIVSCDFIGFLIVSQKLELTMLYQQLIEKLAGITVKQSTYGKLYPLYIAADLAHLVDERITPFIESQVRQALAKTGTLSLYTRGLTNVPFEKRLVDKELSQQLTQRIQQDIAQLSKELSSLNWYKISLSLNSLKTYNKEFLGDDPVIIEQVTQIESELFEALYSIKVLTSKEYSYLLLYAKKSNRVNDQRSLSKLIDKLLTDHLDTFIDQLADLISYMAKEQISSNFIDKIQLKWQQTEALHFSSHPTVLIAQLDDVITYKLVPFIPNSAKQTLLNNLKLNQASVKLCPEQRGYLKALCLKIGCDENQVNQALASKPTPTPFFENHDNNNTTAIACSSSSSKNQ